MPRCHVQCDANFKKIVLRFGGNVVERRHQCRSRNHAALRFSMSACDSSAEKNFTAVKLPESPLDDFIRVLVGTRLDRLGDQVFMLRSKGNRHTHLPAIVATSAYHGNAWDFPAGMASEKSGSWRTRADLEVCPTRSDQ